MIIKRLILNDFRVFYGRQRVELGPGLYIIHGENGRGKSTLLNAIQWAFFGRYEDRQGNIVVPRVILNRDARREGKTDFSVEVLLDDAGRQILIRRSCDLSGGEPHTTLYVEHDGDALDERSAQILLRNLLDEEVSRFFLFDGEQLREYEELLFDEDAAQTVRRSIEQILGLPALTNTVEDLDAIADDFGREVTKAARRDDRTQRAALRAQQLEQELNDAQDDLARLVEQRGEAEAEIGKANETLQQYEAASDLLRQIEGVEAEVKKLEEEEDRESERLQKSLSDTWRDVLAAAVEGRRREIDAALERQRQIERNVAEAERLEASLRDDTCAQCGQTLPESATTALRTRLAELRKDTAGDVDLADLRDTSLTLGAISRVGRLEEAIESNRTINRTRYDIATRKQELDDLRGRAQEIPESEIRIAARSRDDAQKRIGAINQRIGEAEARVAEISTNLKTVRDEIEKTSGSDEVAAIRRRHRLADDVRQIFDAAKDQFRDDRRTHVERDASQIFSVLTTEPEYTGLRINANYGLETLGPDGEPVPGRSAGQEQVVALALIGALNRNATRRAPVMMDTPLGRLDTKHRAKVLGFLADMAEQVFLLVHSAEVNEADLKVIRATITSEFELEREALYRTQIRPRDLA